MMIRHRLTAFGIPCTNDSDRGPQFTGSLFKAMCSLMGIPDAKIVAYLSRSNGRAEVARRPLEKTLALRPSTSVPWGRAVQGAVERLCAVP